MQSLVVGVMASAGITASNSIYQNDMSNKPKPTTISPITAPERKAILSPLFREVRAALAVRAEASVAVFMPMYPDRPEKNPPVKNAIGTQWFCTSRT